MKEIFLSPELIVVLLALSVYIVMTAKIGWAIGIYTALPAWLIVIRFGSVNHLWVYLATMAGAMVVYIERHPKKSWLPKQSRWIIPWILLWTAWMLFVISLNQGNNSVNLGIVQSLLLYTLVPLPGFLILATDQPALFDFARIFVVTTALGGLLALLRMTSNLAIPLDYLLHDPFLSKYVVAGQVHWFAYEMGYVNYHWLAYGCSVALLFTLHLWSFSKQIIEQVVWALLAVFLMYLLLILGSRQSLWVSVAIAIPYLLWLRFRATGTTRLGLVIAVTVVILGITTLLAAQPDILLRSSDSLLDSLDVVSNRGSIWEAGLQAFQASPIVGDSFSGSPSLGHNYFISTLANQGIVGMIFLCGFIAFVIRQMRGFRRWSVMNDLDSWRMAFLVIGLFSFTVAQVSGSPVSNWPIFWGAAVLWKCRDQDTSTAPVRLLGYSFTPRKHPTHKPMTIMTQENETRAKVDGKIT